MYETILTGKAYEDDEHDYGEIYQMFDFLRALGGVDPMPRLDSLNPLRLPSLERLQAEWTKQVK